MWLFEDKEFVEDTTLWYGYVYMIENIATGKKYIGRKFFTAAGYKQVKGKRKKIRKDSDWANYFGSSPSLLKDIELFGKDNFKRTILKLCRGRAECSYWETKYIFEHDALLNGNYYNSWVQCKIQATHLKALLFNQPEGN